jgi:hypothetical protein
MSLTKRQLNRAILFWRLEASRRSLFPFVLSLLLALMAFPASPEDTSSFKLNLSFKLTGGWGSALPTNDVNRQLESFNNNAKFVYLRQYDPRSVLGEITTLDNQVHEWEAELRMDFSSHISLGIATALPYKKTNESTLRYTIFGPYGQQVHDFIYHPTITVGPPLRFTLYYSPFSGSRFRAYINGGIGLYPARIEEDRILTKTFPLGDSGRTERHTDVQPAYPLGFHCGLDLEYSFIKSLALVIEAQWRYIKLTDFQGTNQYFIQEWSSTGELTKTVYDDVHGTLYYCTQWDDDIGSRYVDLFVWDKIPDVSISFYEDIRKVKLDLSRFALRIGLKIRLF